MLPKLRFKQARGENRKNSHGEKKDLNPCDPGFIWNCFVWTNSKSDHLYLENFKRKSFLVEILI